MLTADYAFALAAILVNLQKTNSKHYDQVVVYHDGLSDEQCIGLRGIEPNTVFIHYSLADWEREHTVHSDGRQKAFLQRFSHFALSKYKMFEQLEYYHQVLFLDLDMLVYGDISPIFDIKGMAWRTEALFVNKFGTFADKASYEGLSEVPTEHPAPNGGLIYADDSIDWRSCLVEANRFINAFSGDFASVLDELTFSWVAHRFNMPVTELNYQIYNTLPRVVTEDTVIVHFMGGGKPWNSELMQLGHPSWMQHYAAAQAYADFTSDKVIRYEPHGQILRKYINQSRWLDLLQKTELLAKLPVQLRLLMNLEGESITLVHSDGICYKFTLNRNMDVCKLSLEIENRLLVADGVLAESLKKLTQQNAQFEFQKHTHKMALTTRASYPTEQLMDAWRYFYRTSWACVEPFV